MKKTIIAILAVLLIALFIACNGDVDGKLFESNKTVVKKYGQDQYAKWIEAPSCTEPTVTYRGTGKTEYKESSEAPTLMGTYVAIFTLDGKSIEVPFEL